MGRFAGDYSPDRYQISIGVPVGPFGASLAAVLLQSGVLPAGFSFPFTVTGYAAGTFVSTARAVQAATKTVGSDGEVTRSKNLDRSSSTTLTLQHSSLANTIFSAFLIAFEQAGVNLVFPMILKDLNSLPTTTHTMPETWVQGWPEDGRAEAEGSFAWVLDSAQHFPLLGSRTR